MTSEKSKEEIWRKLERAAVAGLEATGDIGRKGVERVVATGLALLAAKAHVDHYPADFPGGWNGWCNKWHVCTKTCDRYAKLAERFDDVAKRAGAGDANAGELYRQLLDDAVTPTVVAAERLLKDHEEAVAGTDGKGKSNGKSKAKFKGKGRRRRKGSIVDAKVVLDVVRQATELTIALASVGSLIADGKAWRDDLTEPLEGLIRAARAVLDAIPEASDPPGRRTDDAPAKTDPDGSLIHAAIERRRREADATQQYVQGQCFPEAEVRRLQDKEAQ